MALVLLIFVHELGHVIELRRQGLPASAPLFIPFLGAMSAEADAGTTSGGGALALAGPILGSAGALACWRLGDALDSDPSLRSPSSASF